MSFNQPFNYDPNSGRWNLELHKAPKDVFAQCGIKISVDPGYPTGEKGAYYQSEEPRGMQGASIGLYLVLWHNLNHLLYKCSEVKDCSGSPASKIIKTANFDTCTLHSARFF